MRIASIILVTLLAAAGCAKKSQAPAAAAPKADKVEKPADQAPGAPAPTEQKSDPCEGGESKTK